MKLSELSVGSRRRSGKSSTKCGPATEKVVPKIQPAVRPAMRRGQSAELWATFLRFMQRKVLGLCNL